jgi:hypothetical protein
VISQHDEAIAQRFWIEMSKWSDESLKLKDPKCQDELKYINQTVPSPYVTEEVDVQRGPTVASN